MATQAAARFLLDLPGRISDALQTAYEESMLCTEAAVASGVARLAGGISDVTAPVNELVSINAEKQRKRLSARLKSMAGSEVFTPADDPRLPKFTLGRLKLAYKAAKAAKEPGQRVLQKEVVRKWKPDRVSQKQLQRWCKDELGLGTWNEVLEYLEET